MKRFVNQELASATVFFAACGWLIVDAVLLGARSDLSHYGLIRFPKL